jgi:hypothetical protein
VPDVRLLVDGVAFRHGPEENLTLWAPLLNRLGSVAGLQVYVLDRGGVPAVHGLRCLPFPDHGHDNAPADSVLVQAMCDQFEIDVFCSTAWTTPLCTPTVAVVTGLPPAPPEAAAVGARHALEPWVALCFAQRFVCLGEDARQGVMRLLPEIPDCQWAVVTVPGDDPQPAPPVDALLSALLEAIARVRDEASGGAYTDFFATWAALRRLQAEVDYKC